MITDWYCLFNGLFCWPEAPDLNPRPLFTSPKPVPSSHLTLGTCWENQAPRDEELLYSDPQHGPMRRSYSDQSFGRTPPTTATHLKHAAALHTHLASPRGSGGSPGQRPTSPGLALALPAARTQPKAPELPESHPSLLSPFPRLQAAWQQASQRLLQAISRKYRLNYPETPARRAGEASGRVNSDTPRKRATESWSPEDEGGAVVEFIVLRRQVLKMSRRLAGLERQNGERKNTEMLLFSLLLSACLLNGWLWIRR